MGTVTHDGPGPEFFLESLTNRQDKRLVGVTREVRLEFVDINRSNEFEKVRVSCDHCQHDLVFQFVIGW